MEEMRKNAEVSFEVLSIHKAKKNGYVVVNVEFTGNSKVYSYVRKFYKKVVDGCKVSSATIDGCEITFDDEYNVKEVVRVYQTEGKKKMDTSNSGSKKKISEEIKEELGILEAEKEKEEEKEEEEYKDGEEVFHEKFETILACVKANIPVYLAGPAGSGKNHTLEQVAKRIGLDFYFTNSVQQEYKLTGFIDAGGAYHETEFYKAFKNGGLFFLDEMDASIPEVLVLLNAAIANGYFEFPNGRITANENFRVVAAGNTVGNGADESYTGRMVLDQATLDRFAVIEFGYSEKIELALSKGNKELVSFIHDMRNEAEKLGIRATFSYRCISMVTKLENVLPLTEVLIIAVFKGFDKDTLNTFSADGATKYHNALRGIKAA